MKTAVRSTKSKGTYVPRSERRFPEARESMGLSLKAKLAKAYLIALSLGLPEGAVDAIVFASRKVDAALENEK